MKIYKVTQQQRDQLIALNSNSANWAACDYENHGVCIEQFTLDNPDYHAHKELFDTFGITEYIDYELPS
jgi:hypothetical protein